MQKSPYLLFFYVFLTLIFTVSPSVNANETQVENAELNTRASATVTANSVIELPQYSKVYDDKRNPFKDAAAAIELAQQTQRNVLIEIGGNWCTWCHKMDAFLDNNPQVYQQLHSQFVVLKINVSDSNDNEDFMKSLPPVLGYPHMYISTAQGKMLLSKDTAELQKNGQYLPELWLAFIKQWQPDNTTTNSKG